MQRIGLFYAAMVICLLVGIGVGYGVTYMTYQPQIVELNSNLHELQSTLHKYESDFMDLNNSNLSTLEELNSLKKEFQNYKMTKRDATKQIEEKLEHAQELNAVNQEAIYQYRGNLDLEMYRYVMLMKKNSEMIEKILDDLKNIFESY